jgi:2-polyprenyl-3-methyl-5-hydroxy-6-metoxy-1,4-benzoquinol methylase
MFYWHTLANRVLTLLANLLNDLNLTDMETCYKLVRADILKSLVICSKGFDLEPELTTKLTRWGARIYEVPISYQGRTYAEGKKIGAIDALKAFKALIKYRFFDRHYSHHDGFMILQAVRRAKRFNRWIFSQVKDWLGDEVMEAGCGIGNLTEMVLNRKRLVCIDNERFYIERLQQAYGHMTNVTFREADLTVPGEIESTAEEGLFDSVLALNVLEHIEDEVGVLRNFRKILKPGGRVILLVPNNPRLYSKVDAALGHFRRYSRDSLTHCLEGAGFRVAECRGFNRLGGLGWRVSGKIFRNTTLSTGQMSLFELLMPLVRVLEKIPFHTHNSLIAVGVRD